ncbi:MAG: hypothetical protein H0Z28_02430 [Archaeoglobus sp.]|nr:hypothetical protein [Archaeoglobus sp.]
MKKISIPPGHLAGLFFIVVFILMGVLLDTLRIKQSFIISMIASLILTLIAYFPVIRKEKKTTALVSVLLILFSIYIIFFFAEFVAIGPKGEQIPFVYLIANFRFENQTISSYYQWEQTEWGSYKPECYSEFYAAKFGNTSLEVSAFYYGYLGNPFYAIPKYLFTKLSCGITDSKTAYTRYKELLLNSGFSIDSRSNSFTARNETTIVYCQLDGDFIMVVKVNKEEEYLLNHTKIMKGMF